MLFSQEQLDFLNKNFARVTHNHTWDEVVDPADQQTVTAAFEGLDEALFETDEAVEVLTARVNELAEEEPMDEEEQSMDDAD